MVALELAGLDAAAPFHAFSGASPRTKAVVLAVLGFTAGLAIDRLLPRGPTRQPGRGSENENDEGPDR